VTLGLCNFKKTKKDHNVKQLSAKFEKYNCGFSVKTGAEKSRLI